MTEHIYQIISREEAKSQGLKRYFTGIPCKYGHIATQLVVSGYCQECDRIRGKRYRDNHPDRKLASNRKYKEQNYEKVMTANRKTQNSRRDSDPLYKMSENIRCLIRNSMKRGGFKKTTKTAEILGCSFEEFKIHIENQFTEGMNWGNQGEWQMDHIYPVAKRRDEAHLIELNHYTNFQPLWAEDNRTKGAKIL